MAHPGGRPSMLYDAEVGKYICKLIQSSTLTIKKICQQNKDLPSYTTVYEWLGDSTEFTELYLSAKRKQVHLYMEDSFELAEDCEKNSESIAYTNMNVNLRKWYAGRLCPRLYGEKTETKSEVNVSVHESDLAHLK